jgi:hypothetical protein
MTSSKQKQQGTAWQRAVRHVMEVRGFKVEVLPEGGVNDEGDLWVPELNMVIECRTRMQMNIHDATLRAQQKAAMIRQARVAVAWKRLGLKPGNRKRTQVGVPIVAMPINQWMDLVTKLRRLEGGEHGQKELD